MRWWALYMGALKNFRESLTTPMATFPEIFNGLLFQSILWMWVQNLKLPTKFEVHSFTGSEDKSNWIGVVNLQSRERGQGRSGFGMVPFKRTLASSYRPSIVSFPPSLRISEILPLLCSSTQLFPTPPLVSQKFPHVSLGVGGWPLGYEERRCWANCLCH